MLNLSIFYKESAQAPWHGAPCNKYYIHRRCTMVILYVLAGLAGLIVLFLLLKVIQLKKGNRQAEEMRQSLPEIKINDFGEVSRLSLLPLVDFQSDRDDLKTEAGVSYLVRADDTTLLLDVGFNAKKEHPSPLMGNMEKLGVTTDSLDMIFISHLHLDHLGGMEDQRAATFSLSKGPVPLKNIPVYAPAEVTPSEHNPEPTVTVTKDPQVLAPGIATLGIIPRNLFLMGLTAEQSLVVNLKGKGLVIIIGCGHQTIERIIERTKQIFDIPIYAVIGGLHFPVKGGRVKIGPLNLQNIVGSDRVPWNGINEKDIASAIDAIEQEKPALVSLSPHDSSDFALDRFRAAFGDRYRDLKVGDEIVM